MITARFSVQWLCLLLACAFILSFIGISLPSLAYPFHLEWMEGHVIDTVQRVVNGQGVYVEPTLEYVALIYMPLYYYVVAFVSWFTGVDFFPARLVSFISALGCGAILYAWVRKEGGNLPAALSAAGLFFATYELNGRWFILARVDSFWLVLSLAALFVSFHYRGWKYALLAGILFFLSCMAKQAAGFAAGAVLLAWLWVDWRKALLTGGVMGAALLAACLWMNSASGGWFNFFIFELPAAHDMSRKIIFGFWTKEMLKPLAILLGLLLYTLVVLVRADKKRGACYVALAVGLVIGSYIMRLHHGSYLNVLMPAHAGLALFAGLALAHVQKLWVPTLISVQFALLLYNPLHMVPTEESVQAGQRFLEDIASIEGDVFIPEMQWVQTRVGKKSYAFGMGAMDVIRADLGKDNPIQVKFLAEYRDALENGRFAAVIPGNLFRLSEKDKYYEFNRKVSYPKEQVAGAINFDRMKLYTRRILPQP